MWYKRDESQKRFSFFFSSVTLAGTFGGLIATGIGHMDYTSGYRAWRWVFIIEGAATAVIAVACFFFIPDFPEDSTFLSPAERAAVHHRLAQDVGSSAHQVDYTWRDIAGVFKDCMCVALIRRRSR
jgi:MFS family permease